MKKTGFEHPLDVSDLELSFAGNVDRLMPKYHDIPERFRGFDHSDKFVKFQSDWFYRCVRNLNATPKRGIDKAKAIRHLSAIQRSWEPKHEHKVAAVAYLASLWFDDIQYTVSNPTEGK